MNPFSEYWGLKSFKKLILRQKQAYSPFTNGEFSIHLFFIYIHSIRSQIQKKISQQKWHSKVINLTCIPLRLVLDLICRGGASRAAAQEADSGRFNGRAARRTRPAVHREGPRMRRCSGPEVQATLVMLQSYVVLGSKWVRHTPSIHPNPYMSPRPSITLYHPLKLKEK